LSRCFWIVAESEASVRSDSGSWERIEERGDRGGDEGPAEADSGNASLIRVGGVDPPEVGVSTCIILVNGIGVEVMDLQDSIS
jgi:hypothetical protein